MASLTTVYFLGILLISIAGMGSVFIANKVNPHSKAEVSQPETEVKTELEEALKLPELPSEENPTLTPSATSAPGPMAPTPPAPAPAPVENPLPRTLTKEETDEIATLAEVPPLLDFQETSGGFGMRGRFPSRLRYRRTGS